MMEYKASIINADQPCSETKVTFFESGRVGISQDDDNVLLTPKQLNALKLIMKVEA